MDDHVNHLPTEILEYYSSGLEESRLTHGTGRLEYVRTQILLRRFLPEPPARILDVGGGSGVHAVSLAREGYDVTLVDPIPLHITQARALARLEQGQHFTARLGDSRELDERDESVDGVLLLGPLYHLTERADRLRSLEEARRVLRPGGVAIAAAISRFASLLDGLWTNRLREPAFASIVDRDLWDGQHRNPENRSGWFTTAYFHHPDELAGEIRDAGFNLHGLFGVEGPGGLLTDTEIEQRWHDGRQRQILLWAIGAVEQEPSLLGASTHVIAVGRKLQK